MMGRTQGANINICLSNGFQLMELAFELFQPFLFGS